MTLGCHERPTERARRRARTRSGDAQARAGRDRAAAAPGRDRGRAQRVAPRPGGGARRAGRARRIRRRSSGRRGARAAAHPDAPRDADAGAARRAGRQAARAAALPRARRAALPVVRSGRAGAARGRGSGNGAAAARPESGDVLPPRSRCAREIARQMHDGPAQSIANIALQAQIVQRLVRARPERAADELKELVAMVQQALEATKTFIFDVRPMVLDDLGLVPTLRRSAAERSRRSERAGALRIRRHRPAPVDRARERPVPHDRRRGRRRTWASARHEHLVAARLVRATRPRHDRAALAAARAERRTARPAPPLPRRVATRRCPISSPR